MNRTFLASFFAVAIITLTAMGQINVTERFVQIRSLDFVNSVIEIRNFGTMDQNLSGWRFCSHDEDQDRRYSAAGGFDGMTLLAGESLFIHLNNDASGPNAINRSAIGGNFALPLDNDGAYAIQFYFQTPFGNGNNIADHVQVSRFGADDLSADERSDEAQSGGVWINQNQWVPVLPETEMVVLKDASSDNEMNGPSDYENVFAFATGDINCDEVVNLLDVSPFIDLLSSGTYNAKGDLNFDGELNLLDVQPFVDVLAGN